MSFDSTDRTFCTQNRNTVPVRERFAAALARVPAKVLARITGRTPEAAKRWKVADNSMSVETLFALARELDEVWEIVRHECGRANTVTEAEAMLDQVTKLLADRRRG